nr:MAG TPA: hypothetical protein [Caudoviricetes sp.]
MRQMYNKSSAKVSKLNYSAQFIIIVYSISVYYIGVFLY